MLSPSPPKITDLAIPGASLRPADLAAAKTAKHEGSERAGEGSSLPLLAKVRADLRVDLPAPRNQITIKELPAFVRLRTEVSRLVRACPSGLAEPGGPG